MTILIIGYPDSGKSKTAEDMALKMSAPGERVYLATMIPYGEDGEARVEKHRKMRAGKGFTTIEAPFDIADALNKERPNNKTILLECLSNLVANELFERKTGADETEHKIVTDIKRLAGMVKNLIIVSNHFEADSGFDADTRLYAYLMDEINDRLSDIADKTIRL